MSPTWPLKNVQYFGIATREAVHGIQPCICGEKNTLLRSLRTLQFTSSDRLLYLFLLCSRGLELYVLAIYFLQRPEWRVLKYRRIKPVGRSLVSGSSNNCGSSSTREHPDPVAVSVTLIVFLVVRERLNILRYFLRRRYFLAYKQECEKTLNCKEKFELNSCIFYLAFLNFINLCMKKYSDILSSSSSWLEIEWLLEKLGTESKHLGYWDKAFAGPAIFNTKHWVVGSIL